MATKRRKQVYFGDFISSSIYFFCSLRSLYVIEKIVIFKLLIDKLQKIRKVNRFLKNSLGGHEVDSWWTLLRIYKFMDFSIL